MFSQLLEETNILGVLGVSNDIANSHNSSLLLNILDMNIHTFPCSFPRYKFCRSFHENFILRS
jgi:hypothetical protein